MVVVTRALLEVIALDAADARAAEDGGADRLEVVTGMDQDGLTPTPEAVAAIRSATALPLRVMLRGGAGFRTDPAETTRLRAQAHDLEAAGADAFVLGFLDADGDLDLAAMSAVSTATDLPWTCHRAIDHARDRDLAWRALRDLPGLDTILTAGSADGVADGLPILERHAAEPGGRRPHPGRWRPAPRPPPGARRRRHHPVPRRQPRAARRILVRAGRRRARADLAGPGRRRHAADRGWRRLGCVACPRELVSRVPASGRP